MAQGHHHHHHNHHPITPSHHQWLLNIIITIITIMFTIIIIITIICMIMRFCALELAIWKRFIQILGFLDFPHEKISITAATNVANIWQIRVQKADEEKIRMAKFNVYEAVTANLK